MLTDMFKIISSSLILLFLTSCATIVNDAEVPVTLSFSDGSSGSCNLSNKRAQYQVEVPGTHRVRRSDDALKYNCKTDGGKTAFGSIPSEMEGAKLAGSVVFFDLGITDSITDKHRTYTPNFTIPVR
ncbi:hypothetical protein OA396_01220 [Candidatus Pelagibacter sp.]|nr:hypothetical protein [Candidatus Pelagibacter sp.]